MILSILNYLILTKRLFYTYKPILYQNPPLSYLPPYYIVLKKRGSREQGLD